MQTKWKVIIVGVLLSTLLVSFAFAKKYKSGPVSNDDKTAFLGVYTQTVDEDIADAFDLGSKYGAVINMVIDDSPAEKAGLHDGDVIIAFNGEKVWDKAALVEFIEDQKPGDVVTLKIASEGKTEDIQVTLDETPDGFNHDTKIWSRSSLGKIPWLSAFHDDDDDDISIYSDRGSYIGVNLQELSDQLGDYFGVKDGEGILITEVVEDSPAEKAGLKAGDIIVSVDKKDVEDYNDIQKTIRQKEIGETVDIGILRDKKQQTITVTVDETPRNNNRYGYHYNAPYISVPNIPDIDVVVPNLRDLRNFHFNDDNEGNYFEYDQYKKAMKEYKAEMKELQKEMQRMKGSQNDELEKELKALKKELEELRLKIED